MPYVIYFSSAIIYFTFFLRTVDDSVFFFIFAGSLKWLVIINMLIFELLEVFQMQLSGWQDYIGEFWNMMD